MNHSIGRGRPEPQEAHMGPMGGGGVSASLGLFSMKGMVGDSQLLLAASPKGLSALACT